VDDFPFVFEGKPSDASIETRRVRYRQSPLGRTNPLRKIPQPKNAAVEPGENFAGFRHGWLNGGKLWLSGC
jgi:hypothetical protein